MYLLILLMSLFTSLSKAQLEPSKSVFKKSSPKPADFGKFIFGVIDGFLEMSFLDKLEICFENFLNLDDEMEKVIISLKKKKYYDGLVSVIDLFSELQKAVKPC